MQALGYEADAGADGEATLPHLSLTQGATVEIIVLVRQPEAEDDQGLRRLAAKTTGFWRNPVDDEVWNNA